MNKNVVFVDDDENITRICCDIIKYCGLNAVGFTDFMEALRYLEDRQESALAYLVDMKPVSRLAGVRVENLTEQEKALLELPERIYGVVKSKGWTDNFYFISGEKSPHDKEVLERTGAKYEQKPLGVSFFQALAKRK